jgi:multidrug efflux system membrane fusion protein
VVQDGKVTLRTVQRGGTFQGRVEITNGLTPGEQVVVAGNTMLREGASVRVVESMRDTLPGAPLRDTAATVAPTTVGVK